MVKHIAWFVVLVNIALASSIPEFPHQILAAMDTSMDPCNDFYQYACGSWINNTVVPFAKESVSLTHDLATETIDNFLLKLIETNTPKVSEFYKSCMDMGAINSLGISSLQDDLKAIREATSTKAILQVAAKLSSKDVHSFVELGVSVDRDDNLKNAIYMYRPLVALKDGYFDNPEKLNDIEPAYRDYITTTLTLAGKSAADAKEAADSIIAFESKYNSFKSPILDYSPMTLAEASTKFPSIIGILLQAHGFDSRDTNKVLLEDLNFFEKAEAHIKVTPLHILKHQVEFRLLVRFGEYLSSDFLAAVFKFFYTEMNGLNLLPSREAFCIGETQRSLGELIGKYFIEANWSKEKKSQAEGMVSKLKSSFNVSIDFAGWPDVETRQRATAKLTSMTSLLGGPKNPQTYPTLQFNTSKFINNRIKVAEVNFKAMLATYNETAERTKWDRSAFEAMTFNSRRENMFGIPAGYFQAPYFDTNADPAQNFGRIGMVIGHEIAHGFDASGSLYDGDGKKNSWLSKSANATFNDKLQCLVDQYNQFEVVSPTSGESFGFVDGQVTLNENIADNSGVRAAFRAYMRNAVDTTSKNANEIGQKLFFVAYAQTMCYVETQESYTYFMHSDLAPYKQRVWGVIQNSDTFASVYNCPVNSPMNPKHKCTIWW